MGEQSAEIGTDVNRHVETCLEEAKRMDHVNGLLAHCANMQKRLQSDLL